MVGSGSKHKAMGFPGVLRISIFADLTAMEHFRKEGTPSPHTHNTPYPLSFPLNLSSSLPAPPSIQSTSFKPCWEPGSPSSLQFSHSPWCRNSRSIPGAHTPSLPLPLHPVSQPPRDSSRTRLCWQQSPSSPCQITPCSSPTSGDHGKAPAASSHPTFTSS